MLTGTFDNSSTTDMSFSKTLDSDNIHIFTATNENCGLQIIKRAYASSSIADIINQQLGAYMQRANEIYINAGATTIDDPSVIADIDIARNSLLSTSTAKWSSNTGVLLNLGPTQIVTAVPLDEPPLDVNAYLTVAPFTNADISSEGIKWRCTAFGFNTELLPSWCIL